MFKRILYLFILSSLFLSGNAFSYQFRDYSWGTPKSEIKEKLISQGKEVTDENNVLYYKDKIFDEDCQVCFIFTLGSQALCVITLTWNDTAVGAKLKEELAKKYGEPVKINPYSQEYTWTGHLEEKCDDLDLNYNRGDTRLQYYGEDCYRA